MLSGKSHIVKIAMEKISKAESTGIGKEGGGSAKDSSKIKVSKAKVGFLWQTSREIIEYQLHSVFAPPEPHNQVCLQLNTLFTGQTQLQETLLILGL